MKPPRGDAKRRRRTPAPPGPRTAESEVSFAEAVALLAQARGTPSWELRQEKERLSQRLRYALRKGTITEVRTGNRRFKLGDITLWAQRKGLNPVGLPAAPVTLAGANTTITHDSSVGAIVSPGSLAECCQELAKAASTISRLEAELAAANRELARLRPIAEHDAQRREKNRKSARKPRR